MFVRFYITPSGDVTLSVPGGKQPTGSPTVRAPSEQDSPPPKKPTEESPPPPRDPNAGRQEPDQSKSQGRIQPEKRALTDDTIDKAFPRGPEQPSGECSMRQFIPDPCKAVDDAVRSIKGLYHNFFSGPKCPPPTNIDNTKVDYMPLYEKSEKNHSEKRAEAMDSEENEIKEMMTNEQKYDM